MFQGRGRLSGALFDAGFRVAEGIDSIYGISYDLLGPAVQRTILCWVDSGLLWLVILAVPFPVDSIASGRVSYPADRRAGRQRLLSFVERLVRWCRRAGVDVIGE